jgi:hypothetical protein
VRARLHRVASLTSTLIPHTRQWGRRAYPGWMRGVSRGAGRPCASTLPINDHCTERQKNN